MSQPKKMIQVPHMTSGRLGRPRTRPAPNVLRINTKSIENTKPVEEQQLRSQVEKEISQCFRECSYSGYACALPVLPQREYCARHILQDASAPYRQCSFAYLSGARCPMPAPVQTAAEGNRRDQGLCFEHARAALATRHRNTAPSPSVTTTETLLSSLQHYIKSERVRTTSCATDVSVVSDPGDDQNGSEAALDPFKHVDAAAVQQAAWTAPLEACSDTDSDADSVTLGRGGTCNAGREDELSGDEHVEYDRHPLRYAGIYTAEEAVCEARCALRLLQTAYMRQMARLKTQLKMERANYLRDLRLEREKYCSINQQTRTRPLSARERRQLRKLKAYAGYHKKHGVDAVLARKLHHKRLKLSQSAPKQSSQGRCTFTEGGVRCETNHLPATKFCLKHILNDTQQVCYTACGAHKGGIVCAEPAIAQVPGALLGCRYHQETPPYTVFAMQMERQKDESDSDSETDTATGSADESHVEDAADLLR